MARTSRNSHGGLKGFKINSEESAVRYIQEFGKTIGSAPVSSGAYSKAINNGGWTTAVGAFDVSNQGLIKSVLWSLSVLSGRSAVGDSEAREIIAMFEETSNAAIDKPIIQTTTSSSSPTPVAVSAVTE